MSTSTPSTAASASHTRASVWATLGTLLGALTTLAGLFNVPTVSHPIQSTATGTGGFMVAVSVIGFLLHSLGVSKAEVTAGGSWVEANVGTLVKAAQAVEQLPGMQVTVAEAKSLAKTVEARIQALEAKAGPAITGDIDALAKAVYQRLLNQQFTPQPAQPSQPAQATPGTPLPPSAQQAS